MPNNDEVGMHRDREVPLIKRNAIIDKLYDFKYKFQDWLAIKRGYIDTDHEPLKCTCGSIDLEECNQDYLNPGYRGNILEFDCRCKKCGKILGHWAYGYWQR